MSVRQTIREIPHITSYAEFRSFLRSLFYAANFSDGVRREARRDNPDAKLLVQRWDEQENKESLESGLH